MKICLETSAIIGFCKDEPDCQPIERLLTLAENYQVEILISNFAWDEQYKPLDELGNSRKERIARLANPSPKVARIGEWVLGEDVLGSDDSVEIGDTLSKTSRPDSEQFLSYAALGLDFFVTKDKHFLKKSVRNKLTKKYKFHIGTPDECIHWIEEGQGG
jgi:hypothetical protein